MQSERNYIEQSMNINTVSFATEMSTVSFDLHSSHYSTRLAPLTAYTIAYH